MARAFSPTRQKMVDLLSDGQAHTREELRACLFDELGSGSNIHAHLTGLRNQLKSRGEDIVCCYENRKYSYRKVKTSPYS